MSEPETPLEQHPLGRPDYDPDAFDDEPTTCRHCGEELDDLSLDDLDGECYPCALKESKLSRNRAVVALAEERALAKEHVKSASANLTVLAAEKRQAEERLAAWTPVMVDVFRKEYNPGVKLKWIEESAERVPEDLRP